MTRIQLAERQQARWGASERLEGRSPAWRPSAGARAEAHGERLNVYLAVIPRARVPWKAAIDPEDEWLALGQQSRAQSERAREIAHRADWEGGWG